MSRAISYSCMGASRRDTSALRKVLQWHCRNVLEENGKESVTLSKGTDTLRVRQAGDGFRTISMAS